ncbi:MAG: apolipoprotein N-acyltransferase [Deltaproteobacteria bacterium]|nr:apolipoprotein N-acyltransferase [Deltaproteobacteria bacterium]
MAHIKKIDILLSSITGVLFAVTFMVPYSGIISWFLLIPLLVAIKDKNPKHAIALGLLAGSISNSLGSYWLIGTLSRFGGFPFPVSLLFLLLLSAFSGLSFGIFSYLTTKLQLLKKRGLSSALAIASIWTSVEYLYPFLFPFTIANPQAHFVPIIQISDLFGIYSVGFLVVLVNVTLMRIYTIIREKRPAPYSEITVSLILLTLSISYGFWRINTEKGLISEAPMLKVGIVQANFDFFEKVEDNQHIISEKHKSMSEALSSPDLIIWPETAVQAWIPISSEQLIENGGIGIPNIPGTYFLVGGLSFETTKTPSDKIELNETRKYNTAFLTDSDGTILGRYHKIKLLLFGEYLPFSDIFPSLQKLSPASGDFVPGRELKLFEIKKKRLKIAPLICYEDIIPSFSRKFVANGANLIVNITNDAWFGKTRAPYQHLLLSIPRAVETRRYLIRATNTGISAIIDPIGRIVEKTEIFKQTSLEGQAAILEGKITLYTKIGDLFPLGCLAFWIGYAVLEKLRRNNIS